MIAIPISSPRHGDTYFFIDGEDFEKIKNFNWNLNGSSKSNVSYVRAHWVKNNKKCSILLHRLITDCPADMIVDHKDHNPLNNCRDNLRICTRSNNGMNMIKPAYAITSSYKGVFYNKRIKRYIAQIGHRSSESYIGCFKTELAAAKAYNIKARELFGEFALLNDVDEKNINEVERQYQSEYRGVHFDNRRGGSINARINIQNKTISLGSFRTELEAAVAYNDACDKYGVPGRKNIILEEL